MTRAPSGYSSICEVSEALPKRQVGSYSPDLSLNLEGRGASLSLELAQRQWCEENRSMCKCRLYFFWLRISSSSCWTALRVVAATHPYAREAETAKKTKEPQEARSRRDKR